MNVSDVLHYQVAILAYKILVKNICIINTPYGNKFKLLSTLIFRCYSICCSMKLFQIEIVQLKEIFEKNGYDNKFFDRCLRTFLMMKMMNCFCGMVDRRKAFSLISSWDHCQRSSPSRISDTPRAGFEPAQNLSSGFVE